MKALMQKPYWLAHYNDKKYVDIRNKIINEFSNLEFVEDTHTYYLNGKEITCVSHITHLFKEPFNTDAMAEATYVRNFNNVNSKYYHMTVSEIKESWSNTSKDACSHGTERHEFAESIFYFMTGQYDKILPAFKDRLQKDYITGEPMFIAVEPKEEAAVSFYNDLPDCLIPMLAETKVYREDLGYSGTFDLLAYYDAPLNGRDENESGLVVLDWKTNKDLYKNFKDKTLLPPFSSLLDMPLSVYKLQLSLYQMALEKIGFKVVARRIMWLLPDGTYKKIALESYTNELEKYLMEHNS